MRSFEEGEAQLLKNLNVRIYYIDEVKRRGFENVLREAISYVSEKTACYGISLDIDVVDPSEAPGVGSPEPEGIFAKELLEGIHLFATDPRLKAFELVEFNPHLDIENKTNNLCQQIFHHLTNGGREQRIASGLPPERKPNFVPRS